MDVIICTLSRIGQILTACSLVMVIINCMYNYYVAWKCEEFYKIPSIYFSANIVNILIEGAMICILFSIGIYYLYFDNNVIMFDKGTILFMLDRIIVPTIIVFLLLLLLLIPLTCRYTSLSKYMSENNVLIGIYIIVSFLLALFLFLSKYYHWMLAYIISSILYAVIFIVALLNNSLSGKLEKKYEYEIIEFKKGPIKHEYIILSHVGDSMLLCVEYDDYTDPKTLKLKTKNYLLLSPQVNSKLRKKSFKQGIKVEVDCNQKNNKIKKCKSI